MGSAFNAITTIKRAVADPITDDTLPLPGALSWGEINSDSALEGTTGVDCKLVHGDRWQEIGGNHTESVNANLKTTIQGNRAQDVLGNQDLTTMGNVTGSVLGNMVHTVVGAELYTNLGAQHHTRVAPRVEVYGADQNTDEPGSHFYNIQNWFHNHFFSHEGVCISLSLKELEMGATEYGVGAKLYDAGYCFAALDLKSFQAEAKEVKAGLHALKARVGSKLGLGPHAGGPHPPVEGSG